MKKLALLLLAGTCFAQAPKLPDINTDYQNKFLIIVTKQQKVALDETNLQKQWDADQKQLDSINADGRALEAKLMADLKLDPTKYTVIFKDDKMQIIPKDEPKK